AAGAMQAATRALRMMVKPEAKRMGVGTDSREKPPVGGGPRHGLRGRFASADVVTRYRHCCRPAAHGWRGDKGGRSGTVAGGGSRHALAAMQRGGGSAHSVHPLSRLRERA